MVGTIGWSKDRTVDQSTCQWNKKSIVIMSDSENEDYSELTSCKTLDDFRTYFQSKNLRFRHTVIQNDHFDDRNGLKSLKNHKAENQDAPTHITETDKATILSKADQWLKDYRTTYPPSTEWKDEMTNLIANRNDNLSIQNKYREYLRNNPPRFEINLDACTLPLQYK